MSAQWTGAVLGMFVVISAAGVNISWAINRLTKAVEANTKTKSEVSA